MNIAITNPVTYNVAYVEIPSIYINVHNNLLTLFLSYKWLDVDGKVLRAGENRYKEEDMEAMFQSQGGTFVPFSAAFKSMFPVGKSPAMWMTLSNEGVLTVMTGIGVDCPDGICRFTTTVIPDETLNTVLGKTGLNQVAVIGALTALVQGVLAA